MPVYVYQCTNCGIQFDKLQSFTDQPLVRCPECGKHKLRKVYQPVGIVFKGSGFYATDHKSPSGNSALRSKENQEQKSTEAKTGEEKSKPVASEKPSGDSASKE